MAKQGIPQTAAGCADLLYQTRQQRLAIQKSVDELSKLETELKEALIQALPKGEASGIAGMIARVAIIPKDVPQAEDWDKIHDYVIQHDAFELFQRRLNDAAVVERWENGEEIPGVAHFNKLTVSCVKV